MLPFGRRTIKFAVLFSHSLHFKCSSSRHVRNVKKELLTMKKRITAQTSTIMGMLIAVSIILSRILFFGWRYIQISFEFVPTIILAALFGPCWTVTVDVRS